MDRKQIRVSAEGREKLDKLAKLDKRTVPATLELLIERAYYERVVGMSLRQLAEVVPKNL